MNRREFLRASAATSLAAAFGLPARAGGPGITRVSVQVANGRRVTPVAPNAYAPYRGYDVREPVLRIRTADGLEGIGRLGCQPEVLKRLLGVDPMRMFQLDDDATVRGPTAEYADLLAELGGSDVALLDLLGKMLKKPIADLLGKRVREQVDVYDSCLYMEDLLKPNERDNLAYLEGGSPPDDPAEMVARKAQWVLKQPGNVRILKIKLGRVKWMGDMAMAVERDIAVVKAIRRAVGKDVVLFVDGNDGYKRQPSAAADFALATKDDLVYAMEEMFPESLVKETREVKRRMREAGLKTKLADGENDRDGIPEKICAERSAAEPLFDINQPDMNENGYLRMMSLARRSASHGMTVAPHNFGSKWGFYSMVHLALVTPNWEFCETDDSQFPALRPEGIVIENGKAKLTGMPGVGVVLDESKLEKPAVVFEV
jgi:L-alanine-DL-glutamate epimerase-like enolase superfamily enzyme